MLTVNEAIDRLSGSARVLTGTQSVALSETGNRVLAEDVQALIDVPPADNSAMDGYALRHGDWPGPDRAMKVSQRITAGSVGSALEPGTLARIFTGAPVPDGADTVVMQENTRIASDGMVEILEPAARGSNIRPRGQDISAGHVILPAGTRLRAQEAGLLASQGLTEISCYRKLKVALLSTGDELVEPGSVAGPGQIYNSNRYSIAGLIKSWGFEFVDLGIGADDPGLLREALESGAGEADVILTSGGVSVGEEDHVREVVESLGSIELHKIRIKPGKPFAFGYIHETPFLGLPGNPVSVMVTLMVIARKFLMQCQGVSNPEVLPLQVPAAFEKPGSSREDYLRVRMTSAGAERFSVDSSGVLNSMCWSDGLVRQQPGQTIRSGDPVDYFPFSFLL